MKKKVALLLAFMMALPLAACGGSQSAQPTGSTASTEQETTGETTGSDDTAAPEESAAPENTQVSLHLGETIPWGDFEFTILDVQLFDSNGFSVDYSTGGRKYSGPSVAVTYSLKNVGKTAASPSGMMLQLNYADGYTFISDVNVNGGQPNIYANGGINMPSELKVLSDEHYYLEAFTVPEVVVESSDEPLFITLSLADSVEDSPFRYDIRPMDETQKEALYQHALDLMDEGRYAAAFSELADLTDYKDVTDLRTKCAVNCYGNKYSDYLTDRFDDFETLSGDALAEALPGSWRNVNDAETWEFSKDGSMDPGRVAPANGSKVTGTWEVSEDTLLLTLIGASGNGTTFTYQVKKVADYGLLFFSQDGDTVSIQKKLAK